MHSFDRNSKILNESLIFNNEKQFVSSINRKRMMSTVEINFFKTDLQLFDQVIENKRSNDQK